MERLELLAELRRSQQEANALLDKPIGGDLIGSILEQCAVLALLVVDLDKENAQFRKELDELKARK